MSRTLFALILSLGFHAAAVAQPVDPNPSVADARGGGQPRLSVRQTALCFNYRTPTYAVNLAARTVRIEHRADEAACGVPPPPFTATYDIPGAFPLGTYTWEYQLVAPGYPAIPPTTGTFAVRPAEQGNLSFDPIQPIALEPVRLTLAVPPVCQRIDSVRPIEGGFRVVKVRRSGGTCGNPPVTQDITLGAFAPGAYRIELALLTPEGATVEESATLIVRPPSTTAPAPDASAAADLSGLWYSPNDAPSTGLSLIHAQNPSAQGRQGTDVVTALWYLYDGAGAPLWYVIVAEGAAGATLTGTVLVFDGAGAQPGSNRVGTATLTFDLGSSTGRLQAQVGARTFNLRIERFRWPIRAWPTGPNFFPPS